VAGVTVRTPYNIVRRNVFYYNDGPGLDISTYDSTYDARFNHVYHNTFYHNGFTLLSGVETWKQVGMLVARHGNSSPATGLAIKNNIFHDDRLHAIEFYYTVRDSQVVANNWEHVGDPLFGDIVSAIDPMDPQRPDLRLTTQSPCIDSGTYLTSITSATGSGASFQVQDAGYFSDGWGIVEGDSVQLESDSQRVRITAVDYGNNTLTVDRSLTWSQGQGVALLYEGAKPDMGAYEFGRLLSTHRGRSPGRGVAGLSVSWRRGLLFEVGLGEAGDVGLQLYAVTGRRLLCRTETGLRAGTHLVGWPSAAPLVGRGVYLARISRAAGERTLPVRVTE
jgi:hypothetical protein